MSRLKDHILIKFISLILVAAIALPVLVKAHHVFENHEHVVCNENITTHFHELDVDCEFYKFKLNNNFYYTYEFEDNFISKSISSLNTIYYTHLRSSEEMTSYLRGPPSVI